MVEQTARVVRSGSDGVWVEAVEDTGGCGACGGKGCGARRLAEVFSAKSRNFRVDTTLTLQPGDRVVVGVPEGAVLAAAGRLYGVPLILMVSGAYLGQTLFSGDWSAVAGLLAGGLIGALFARSRHRSFPVVLRQETLLQSKKGYCR